MGIGYWFDRYSVMDNYQKMEQFLKSAEQEEKGSVFLYEADTDGAITEKYSYDGKEMSVMSHKMMRVRIQSLYLHTYRYQK